MRKILITVEIEDNDVIELQLYNMVKSWSCFKDFRVLTNTDRLKETDVHFQKMLSELSKQRKAVDDYINKHNYVK